MTNNFGRPDRAGPADNSANEFEAELAAARRTITAQSAHMQVLASVVAESHAPNGPPSSNDHDREQIRFLAERLEAIESSTSWRLTAPVRGVKTALRSAKRRVIGSLRRSPRPLLGFGREPLVSVIVPNYNHEKYLVRRLESIYGQTYKNIEVILLDDKSTDSSADILNRYAALYPTNTIVALNSANSGGPFRQWAKGIGLAHGEIVWIAESDDSCDANFVKNLVPFFDDEAVLLAYGDIQYIDEDDHELAGLDQYRRGTGFNQWETRYIRASAQEFDGPFGIRNIIPNVSGACFRKPVLTSEFVEQLASYKVCGDWDFYISAAAGGKIAYNPDAKSYYRQHYNNTSVSSAKNQNFYDEHRLIAKALRTQYGVNATTLHKNFASIRETYNHHFSKSPATFLIEDAYDVESVLTINKKSINILICLLSFTMGGGELLPIFLANSLRRHGHNVTVLSLDNATGDDSDTRARLDSNIAVIRPSKIGDLDSFLHEYKIDVINTHNIGAEYFFKQLNIETIERPAYVVTHHGSYEISQALPSHLQDFGRFVDHWIYLTDKNLHRLHHAGVRIEQKTKLPNGVPSVSVGAGPTRSELGIDEDAFVCAIVSRALPHKGWQEAIDAVTRANLAGRRVELLLVGGGPEHDRLSKVILPNFIHLLGARPDGAKYYHVADVGLLPTYFAGESFPLTVAECLVEGRPCIATDRGEIRRMLTDQEGRVAGVVVEGVAGGEQLTGQLLHAIDSLRNDSAMYLAAASVARDCGLGLNIDSIANRYVEVFRGAIASRRERT